MNEAPKYSTKFEDLNFKFNEEKLKFSTKIPDTGGLSQILEVSLEKWSEPSVHCLEGICRCSSIGGNVTFHRDFKMASLCLYGPSEDYQSSFSTADRRLLRKCVDVPIRIMMLTTSRMLISIRLRVLICNPSCFASRDLRLFLVNNLGHLLPKALNIGCRWHLAVVKEFACSLEAF